MQKLKLFIFILGSVLLFSSCTQSKENKETATDIAKVEKNIYIQLYSVRDDIKADFDSTITKVAEAGYRGVEAANYNDFRWRDW